MVDIYHSFNEGHKQLTQDLYDLHKLSVLSALKSYGNIHLITTHLGRDFLATLPYTSIEVIDHSFDYGNFLFSSQYSRVWSMIKLIAYKHASKKRRKFLHIDYDVFLFKKLPEYITNGEIICQNMENKSIIDYWYFTEVFDELCGNKLFFDMDIKFAPNCGVFGGSNYDFIIFYVDTAFKLLEDPQNYYYWAEANNKICEIAKKKENTDSFIWNWEAGIFEQYFLSQCLVHKNINPTLLFDLQDYFGLEDFSQKTRLRSEELGYTHLLSYAKSDPKILQAVRRKIEELS